MATEAQKRARKRWRERTDRKKIEAYLPQRVVDRLDKCPNTPAGTPVNSMGCPLPVDSDGDGVVDSQDQCPGAASAPRRHTGIPSNRWCVLS